MVYCEVFNHKETYVRLSYIVVVKFLWVYYVFSKYPPRSIYHDDRFEHNVPNGKTRKLKTLRSMTLYDISPLVSRSVSLYDPKGHGTTVSD